jgi:hypothetical protein
MCTNCASDVDHGDAVSVVDRYVEGGDGDGTRYSERTLVSMAMTVFLWRWKRDIKMCPLQERKKIFGSSAGILNLSHMS